MTNPQIQNDPIITLPVLNINGLIVSNDATTPNTKVNISAGTARDANNVMDITLGAANPNLEGSTVAAPLVVNAAVNGANGLDTGSLAASKVYAVYVIADSRYYNAVAGIITLASNSAPQMPFGYDSYRLIGYAVTDGSSHFLKMYVSGNGNARVFTYDAPISVGTTNASAAYADIDLSAFVPVVDNLPVSIAYDFVPNADGDSFELHGANSTGDAVTIIAPTAAKHVGANTQVLAQTKASKPQISYKTAAAIGSLALKVAGFNFPV